MPNLSYRFRNTAASAGKTAVAAALGAAVTQVLPAVLPFPFNIIATAAASAFVRGVGNTAKHKYGVKVPF
jgi:hypothetical protein